MNQINKEPSKHAIKKANISVALNEIRDLEKRYSPDVIESACSIYKHMSLRIRNANKKIKFLEKELEKSKLQLHMKVKP